jgi:signal peptidase I
MAARRLIRPGNLLLLATAVLFAGWFLLLRPAFLGGPASYVWVSGGSMKPTLQGGSLVIAREQGRYGMGDIVAFRLAKHKGGGNAVVIHRIVGGSAEEGFITQGDNNQARDPWRLNEGDIVGEMWFSAPGAGRVLAVLRAPVMLAGLAAAVAVFLMLSGPEGRKLPRQPAPPPQGPPASRVAPRHRFRLPLGPTLFLLLALLLTRMTALSLKARR